MGVRPKLTLVSFYFWFLHLSLNCGRFQIPDFLCAFVGSHVPAILADIITVSVFVYFVDTESETNPNDNLMMSRAGLSK